ncbi:MAG: PF13754 domain-containing protein [Gallintestinimicrobium sp.]
MGNCNPRVKSGAYAVELTAVDEAGNETFCTKYILTVDLGALAVKLEPFPYSVQLLQSSFREGMRMTATFDYGESKHIRLLVVSRKRKILTYRARRMSLRRMAQTIRKTAAMWLLMNMF